jgi:hypothetical protein
MSNPEMYTDRRCTGSQNWWKSRFLWFIVKPVQLSFESWKISKTVYQPVLSVYQLVFYSFKNRPVSILWTMLPTREQKHVTLHQSPLPHVFFYIWFRSEAEEERKQQQDAERPASAGREALRAVHRNEGVAGAATEGCSVAEAARARGERRRVEAAAGGVRRAARRENGYVLADECFRTLSEKRRAFNSNDALSCSQEMIFTVASCQGERALTFLRRRIALSLQWEFQCD